MYQAILVACRWHSKSHICCLLRHSITWARDAVRRGMSFCTWHLFAITGSCWYLSLCIQLFPSVPPDSEFGKVPAGFCRDSQHLGCKFFPWNDEKWPFSLDLSNPRKKFINFKTSLDSIHDLAFTNKWTITVHEYIYAITNFIAINKHFFLIEITTILNCECYLLLQLVYLELNLIFSGECIASWCSVCWCFYIRLNLYKCWCSQQTEILSILDQINLFIF